MNAFVHLFFRECSFVSFAFYPNATAVSAKTGYVKKQKDAIQNSI